MTRALAPLPILLTALACEPADPSDRMTILIGGGAPTVRMDLDPLTLTEVDNNVEVSVSFAMEDGETDEEGKVLVLSQYRIDYGFGESCATDAVTELCAPYIAGEINTEVAEGGSVDLVLRGAVRAQTDWVWSVYTGGEFDVPARLSFQGVYDDFTGVTVSAEYTATFADYR